MFCRRRTRRRQRGHVGPRTAASRCVPAAAGTTSRAGPRSTAALVIDVSRMKSIDDRRGRPHRDCRDRAHPDGGGRRARRSAAIAIPTGSEGGVGLGGVVLGGGFGLLTRSIGFGLRQPARRRDCRAPTARRLGEGRSRPTPSTDSDLLWACRGGGGGNFGIATSYTFKLHELSDVPFLIAKWAGRDQLARCLAQLGSATRRSPTNTLTQRSSRDRRHASRALRACCTAERADDLMERARLTAGTSATPTVTVTRGLLAHRLRRTSTESRPSRYRQLEVLLPVRQTSRSPTRRST